MTSSPFASRSLLPAALAVVFAAGGDPAAAADPARPNVVLFFVDDFGQRDLSVYGSSLYETPHMDRLAAEGMLFTNAYAAHPRCVPSRQGLLSGKYPSRVEAESIAAGEREHALPLSQVTFAEVLREAGYQTCYIGKWHLGEEGGGPGAQGCGTVVHAGSAGATGSYFAPFTVEKGHSVENPIVGDDGEYLTDRLTDAAVDYIDANADAPFLLVLAHYAVHTPFEAPEGVTKKYQRKLRRSGVEVGGKRDDADLVEDRQGFTKTVQNNPTYAAMVERTDDSLGRVLAALTEAGVADETAVILTSDHGGLSTRGAGNRRALATSNAPLRQGKGSIFEGGTRVPLIVRWPGRVEPGSTSGVRVTGTDHYPTLLGIAGVPLRPEQHVDGRSYLPALGGGSYERDGLFWYKWQARPDSTGDTRAISYVAGDDKVIEWLDEDLVELFNLREDPGERRDLSEQMPDLTRDLLGKLHAVENDIGDLRERGRKALERRLSRKKPGRDDD